MLASEECWLPDGSYFKSLADKAQMGPLGGALISPATRSDMDNRGVR